MLVDAISGRRRTEFVRRRVVHAGIESNVSDAVYSVQFIYYCAPTRSVLCQCFASLDSSLGCGGEITDSRTDWVMFEWVMHRERMDESAGLVPLGDTSVCGWNQVPVRTPTDLSTFIATYTRTTLLPIPRDTNPVHSSICAHFTQAHIPRILASPKKLCPLPKSQGRTRGDKHPDQSRWTAR